MRRLATLLVLASVFSCDRLRAATLPEQLALAEKAEDIHAQIEILRRILEKHPDDPELQERLVRAWLTVRDYDMAEAALKQWKNAPQTLRAEVGAEVLFHRDEDPAAAIVLLEAYRSRFPEDISRTRQLAGLLIAVDRRRDAVTLLETAPGVPDQADLLLQRAHAKKFLGDFEGAWADFELAAARDPALASRDRPSFERLQAALPAIRQAEARLRNNPDDFAALIPRAQLLAEVGAQSDAVRADVTRAWQAAPGSMASRIFYSRFVLPASRARSELGVDASAPTLSAPDLARLIALDQAVLAKPRDAAALAARSFALNDTPAQYELALRDADAALAIDPSQGTALVEKIFAEIKLGRVDRAEAVFPRLEAANVPAETVARACQYLADGALRANQLEPALRYATRGLRAGPTVDLYRTRAAILSRLGREDAARADLAAAKKLGKQ